MLMLLKVDCSLVDLGWAQPAGSALEGVSCAGAKLWAGFKGQVWRSVATQSVLFSWQIIEVQEGKHNCWNTFKVSACVTCTKVSLAKASSLAKPNINGGGVGGVEHRAVNSSTVGG